MTQLKNLKDAMHSPPDFQPAPVDLKQVMIAGGRMRRRRRLAVGGAYALTVAALLIGGSQLINPDRPVSPIPMAGPSTPLPPNETSVPRPSSDRSAVRTPMTPGVLGGIVDTGRQAGGRQWVIYVETVDPDRLDETFTLILGRTRTGTVNDLSAEIVSGDSGSDRMAPGFHAVQAGRLLDGRTTPTFGYYVGDAARITARDVATGKILEAKRTPWSDFGEVDKAQIFWFDFAQGRPPASLIEISAYDRNGIELHIDG